AAAPDGSLYLGTEDGELWRWQAAREGPERLFAAESRSPLAWLAANGDQVACAWGDGPAAVWFAGEMRPLDGPWGVRHPGALLAWPDGAFVWACASGSVWVSRRDECYPVSLPFREPLRTAAIDPHNQRTLFACEGGRLCLGRRPERGDFAVVRLP